jgi:hypothetical protein
MRRDTTSRARLKAKVKLPVHGMVLQAWGLNGESRLTLDLDTTTLRLDSDIMRGEDDAAAEDLAVRELEARPSRSTRGRRADPGTGRHEVLSYRRGLRKNAALRARSSASAG